MTNDQRPKTKDQRPKTKDQRPKTKDQRPKTKDRRPTQLRNDAVVDRGHAEDGGRNCRGERVDRQSATNGQITHAKRPLVGNRDPHC